MWSTIELAGHDCEVFEPTQPSEHQYVIVYLHGVSGEWLNDKPAFTDGSSVHVRNAAGGPIGFVMNLICKKLLRALSKMM